MVLKTQSSDTSTSSSEENTAPNNVKKQTIFTSPKTKTKTKKTPKKEDLWKNALIKAVGDDGCRVELCGMKSKNHTVYARVVPGDAPSEDDMSKISVEQVLQVMVDEEWDQLIHNILEQHQTVEKDAYPNAQGLLELGAVWLLNETLYMKGGGAAAQRLKNGDLCPDWKDFTLRVHAVPQRYFVAHEYDWTKYCRGRLIGDSIHVQINKETPPVPVSGMPDQKDGVLVYDDPNLGFAVLCKPAPMPGHATLDNHAEDCCSMYQKALENTRHISLPPRLDGEYLDTSGLLLVSTQKQFLHYMEHAHLDSLAGYGKTKVVKKYRCLVCVKDPSKMDLLESYVQKKTMITHYYNHQTKQYRKHKPKNNNRSPSNANKWHAVKMRLTDVGDNQDERLQLRAACVSTPDAGANHPDCTLARRLWGIKISENPAKDLNVKYVMQVEVEPLTGRLHQIRCQLAEMGFPIVGDTERGGGICECHGHQHKWQRLALQCCELSFQEPQRFENTKNLIPNPQRRCEFRLREAWWTELMSNYEEGI